MKETQSTLTMVEAAKLAGVAERTIRRAVKAERLPADLSNPRKARIKQDDLERWKQRTLQPRQGTIPTPIAEEQTLLRRIASLEQQVTSIAALQQRVSQLEQQLDQGRRKILPVALVAFARVHNVAATEYQRAINMHVLPVVCQGQTVYLDGLGQRAFWQVFHELPSYTPCAQCPH